MKTCILIVCALASPAILSAAENVQLYSAWTVTPETEQWKAGNPRGEIRVLRLLAGKPRDGGNQPPQEKTGDVFKRDGAALKEGFWVVTAQAGDAAAKPVKFELRPAASSTGDISYLLFVPENAPEKDVVYQIRPAAGHSLQGILASHYGLSAAAEKKFLESKVDNTFQDADVGYVDGNKALAPDFSIKTGKDSVVKFKAYYGTNIFQQEARTRLESSINVEASYKPQIEKQYINKIEADLNALWRPRPQTGQAFNSLSQFGLNGRLETNQKFTDADYSVGVTSITAFNGTALQALAEVLCWHGSWAGNAPSALIAVNYDYVGNIKEDAALRLRKTETTTDRARVQLYWSTKLARKMDWRALFFAKDLYDVDLVIDAGAAYDRKNRETLPDVNISIEIGPTLASSNNVSLVVTYLNGKTKARFENYEGVLAGLKKAF